MMWRIPILFVLSCAVLVFFAGCGDEDKPVAPNISDPDPPPPGFVKIFHGSFMMGTPADEIGHFIDEAPLHRVNLTHDYFMQATEVTNRQYIELAQFAVDNDYAEVTEDGLCDALDNSTEILLYIHENDCEIGYSEGTFGLKELFEANLDHPVKLVSWYGAAAYCDWLSLKEDIPRAYDHETWECTVYSISGYRLPTEAEWENACRADATTAFANGPISERFCGLDPVLDEIGWYCGNANDWSRPVAQKIPNAHGLYDMHGNAWEWCNDWYSDEYYRSGENEDPVGRLHGTRRCLRGGNWQHAAEVCRSGDRNSYQAMIANRYIGFRPVNALAQQPGDL